MAKLKEINQKKYRAVIQYDRDFPKYFDLGDLTKNEANVVYAILGEIRDRYNSEGVVFSYSNIAYMSDNVTKSSKDGLYYANTGKDFDMFIEVIETKLRNVSYKKPLKIGRGGFDIYPLFNQFTLNHERQELIVHVSDKVFQDEIIDEEGNIVQKKKKISDLFNNEDWSETKYLKYGRELHNKLKKYAQNLYRWIAEYRSFTREIVIGAEEFENRVMKFNNSYAKKNKLSILRDAIEELQSLTYDDGRQIIKDLKFKTEKKGRKISKYIFSFKPFSIDLNYIKEIEGSNITFAASQLNAPDNQIEHTRIIEKFLETFSGQKEYDNKNNRKRLIAFCESMSDDVVEEALDRVAMDKKRGAGWLFKMLENWEKQGVKKLEDIEGAEDEIFNPQKKNVPSWSNPDYVNTTTEEQKQEAEKETLRLLDELNKKKPHNHKKNNVPSWSNPDYINTTSDDTKAELEQKKQEMLARLDNKPQK